MDERKHTAQDQRAAWQAMIEDAAKHPAELNHIAIERERRLRRSAEIEQMKAERKECNDEYEARHV